MAIRWNRFPAPGRRTGVKLTLSALFWQVVLSEGVHHLRSVFRAVPLGLFLYISPSLPPTHASRLLTMNAAQPHSGAQALVLPQCTNPAPPYSFFNPSASPSTYALMSGSLEPQARMYSWVHQPIHNNSALSCADFHGELHHHHPHNDPQQQPLLRASGDERIHPDSSGLDWVRECHGTEDSLANENAIRIALVEVILYDSPGIMPKYRTPPCRSRRRTMSSSVIPRPSAIRAVSSKL